VVSLLWTLGIWAVALLIIARGNLHELVYRKQSGWAIERIAMVLVLLGSFTNAARASADEVLADPVVLERVIRGGLAGIALLFVLPAVFRGIRSTPLRAAPGLTALWFYALVGGVSILYSVAPIVTGPKAIELAAGLVIITSLALSDNARGNLRQAIRFVVALDAALIGTAVLGFFVVPSTFASVQFRPGFILAKTMTSPWASSNNLSTSGSVVAAFALASFFESETRRQKAGWIVLFLSGTAGTLLASGRQGIAMWMAATGLLLWFHRRHLFILMIGPATAAMVYLNWDSVLTILARNQSQESLALLTGRLRFWEAAVESWIQHPFTGYGFGAGGRFVALASIGEGTRSNLHSGYLEALLGVGLLGLIPLTYALIRALRWSFHNLRSRIDTDLAILIVPLALHTAVDLGFGAWLKPDFLILAGIVALADHELRGRRTLDFHDSQAPRVPRGQLAGRQ